MPKCRAPSNFLFGAILLSGFSYAAGKNVETKGDDYVATGYSKADDELEARKDSCNDAKNQLVQFVFGASYSFKTDAIKTIGTVQYLQDSSVDSGQIILRGVTTENSKEDDITKCILTFPISEASIEKERLKSADRWGKSTQFNEAGNTGSMKGGVLEVVTLPEGAEVLIDNYPYGKTPLRLYGQISLGKEHTLRIEHENYQFLERTFTIKELGKVIFKEQLQRATGTINISSDPNDALVYLNNEKVGSTPLEDLKVLAGQKINIQIVHPEADDYNQTVRLVGEEVKDLQIKLALKPAYLTLNVVPNSGISISIDGISKSAYQPNKRIRVEPGQRAVAVSKEGFASQTITVELKGGESAAPPTIKLEKEAKVVENKKKPEPFKVLTWEDYIPFWELSFNWELAMSPTSSPSYLTWPPGLGLKLNVFNSVGFGIGYWYGSYTIHYSGSSTNSDGTGCAGNCIGYSFSRIHAGIPISLISELQSLPTTFRKVVLEPHWAYIANSYSNHATGVSVSNSEKGVGLTLRLQFWRKPEQNQGSILGLGGFLDFTDFYSATSGFTGANSISFGADLSWGF